MYKSKSKTYNDLEMETKTTVATFFITCVYTETLLQNSFYLLSNKLSKCTTCHVQRSGIKSLNTVQSFCFHIYEEKKANKDFLTYLLRSLPWETYGSAQSGLDQISGLECFFMCVKLPQPLSHWYSQHGGVSESD